MGKLQSHKARVTWWLASIYIPACTLFLPMLYLTLHLPSPLSHPHHCSHTQTAQTKTDTSDLHGTPCPPCQWESALSSKSAYFVSSRSHAEPVGSLTQHLPASWLLRPWLWRLHLLTLLVKFNPERQLCTRIQAVNTGVTLYFARRVLHWSGGFSLHCHPLISRYVCVGGQNGQTCLY